MRTVRLSFDDWLLDHVAYGQSSDVGLTLGILVTSGRGPPSRSQSLCYRCREPFRCEGGMAMFKEAWKMATISKLHRARSYSHPSTTAPAIRPMIHPGMTY